MAGAVHLITRGGPDTDLRRVGTNKKYRSGPYGKRAVLDPRGLDVAKLLPSDGGPGAGWLDIAEIEDRDFGCRGFTVPDFG